MEKRISIFEAVSRWLIAVWTVGAAFALTYLASPFIEPGVSPIFLHTFKIYQT